MFVKLIKFRMLVLLATTFLLCQCTQTVNSTEPMPVVNKKIANPYKLPAAEYLAQAQRQEGSEKQALLLQAAGRLLAENQWRQGAAILAQTYDLTPLQSDEKKLLLAQIDLTHDKSSLAVEKLQAIKKPEQLSRYHQIQLHELLAQAHRLNQHDTQSIAERIKLETLLTDEDGRVANRRALWLTLLNVPDNELRMLTAEAAERSELQGWLQLALISHQYRSNPQSLLTSLDEWQVRFNNHPANSLLPNPLDSITNKIVQQPKQIALLLPLSGPLAGPGNAIRDGFLAAYKHSTSKTQTKVQFYDTNAKEIVPVYEQAVQEGADYIIGPLTKAEVARIASINHPVPTLLLNDSEGPAEENSYSFGLSAANEVKQVSLRAHHKGYKRALVIAPDNSWGKELVSAFNKDWQALGGVVVDEYTYGEHDDLNKKMRDFLHISNGETRERQVKELLGLTLETAPSRRQDFDMIFLLAYPTKARQIMPLLKYYYTGDMPVFATSSVYTGQANALKDKDLDGLIFCDIPWVFAHQMGAKNWPEQFNSYNRLYALGKDSYALTTQLNHLLLFPADGTRDSSGTLYLNASQQVARVLEWGQFRQGLVHSLGELA
jgi:outer membrane PBP1 activator LpoA protein